MIIVTHKYTNSFMFFHTEIAMCTSVNNIRRILGTFFNWLYQTHWIPENPMFYVKPIRGLKKVYEPISPEQFEQIMGKIDNQRDKALLAVIAGSGIRKGKPVRC